MKGLREGRWARTPLPMKLTIIQTDYQVTYISYIPSLQKICSFSSTFLFDLPFSPTFLLNLFGYPNIYYINNKINK